MRDKPYVYFVETWWQNTKPSAVFGRLNVPLTLLSATTEGHTGWAKKVIPLGHILHCTRDITFLAHPVGPVPCSHYVFSHCGPTQK